MGTFGSGLWGSVGGTGGAAPAPGVLIRELLRSSFRCIGSLRVGFGYSPSERVDALFVLNAMLDGWAAEELNAPSSITGLYPLVTAKQNYTIGPGGDFDGPRPIEIIDARYVVMTNPTQPLYLPLDFTNDQQFLSIRLPQTQSTIPTKLYYNPTYPLGTVTLWPVPTNSADQVAICSAQFIGGGITDENSVLSVPPGYLDAIRYNLAVRLAMEWDKPLKEGVAKLASDTLATIQRLNAPTPQMDCNPGVLPIRSGRSGFSRLTGD